MKNIRYIIVTVMALGAAAACSKNDYKLFDSSDSGIYYTVEEVAYSFGVSPTGVTHRVVEIPVRIMGATSTAPRTFTVEVIADKTTAQAGTHYILPDELTIMPDSVNGSIPLDIIRGELGEEEWTLGLRLTANDNFSPVEKEGTEVTVTFNNIVTPPNWTSYNWSTGKYVPYWPTQLGTWAPIKYILFMENFHKMEQSAPSTYRNLVDLYGPELENITNGWPWDYDYTLTKYVLGPIYDYLVAHPELGESIPKPY